MSEQARTMAQPLGGLLGQRGQRLARQRRIGGVAGEGDRRVLRQHCQDGRLDVARICDTVPGWAEADVWFCGPGGFGQSLREGFVARGLPAADFHQELFDMR